METQVKPKFYARVKWTLTITEDRESLVPIYDVDRYSRKSVLEGCERAAIESYSEIKEHPEYMSPSNIKLEHEVLGFMPLNEDGIADTEQYCELRAS